jgi:glutamyl-tRNA synthetase
LGASLGGAKKSMAISWVQIAIYQAAEWDIPSFAHIPLIFGGDGKKLSKRHGATGMSQREVIQSFTSR